MSNEENYVKALCDELSIPCKGEWIICPECRGNGTELKGGLKGADVSELIADDPDFYDEYMGGAYDTGCSNCKGSGKVMDYTPDFTRESASTIEKYNEAMESHSQHLREEAEYARLRERGIQF